MAHFDVNMFLIDRSRGAYQIFIFIFHCPKIFITSICVTLSIYCIVYDMSCRYKKHLLNVVVIVW
jgi:hypothetical protein